MRRRRLKLIVLYLVLLIGGWYVGHAIVDLLAFDVRPHTETRVHAMIMTAIGVFVVTSAVPFVPGAEIGLGLIFVFGAKIAFLVYVSMVAALILSYLVGRFVPALYVASAFGYFGLAKARELVLRMAPLDAEGRLGLLTAEAPSTWIPKLLRYRYLALVVLLNLPGNSVIGGGGGIAFTAGLSGLYSFPAYFLAVLVAVAPVPLFVVASAYFA